MNTTIVVTAIICGTIVLLSAINHLTAPNPTKVSDATANRCLRLLETYLLDHQNKTVEVDTDRHGNIIMTIKMRGE